MRTETAVRTFLEGYNCAQAVFHAFAADLGMDPDAALKAACGFGGGMGRNGEVCGAVSGAVLAIGLRFGRGKGQDKEAAEASYRKVRELMDRFRREHGSFLCRRLIDGCDLATEEGLRFYNEKDLRGRVCRHFVHTSARVLEDLLGPGA